MVVYKLHDSTHYLYSYMKYYTIYTLALGPVVRSKASANPGLNFNPLFSFLRFYTSVSLKTSETKTSNDPDKISEEIFLIFQTSCWEISLGSDLTQG